MSTGYRTKLPIFGQVILGSSAFLLLVCAGQSKVWGASGKTDGASTDRVLTVQSAYSNTNNRPDPFLPVKLKGKSASPMASVNDHELHLQGILWHPTKPAAVVNRQSIALNETVTLKLSSGDVPVRAISIERDRVILKIADREVELQLEKPGTN